MKLQLTRLFKGIFLLLMLTHSLNAAQWTPPVNVSTVSSFFPVMGMDAQGNTVVIWRGIVGGVTVIQASTLAFGSDIWSAPVTISTPGVNANDPDLAVGANGNAVAVWRRTSNNVIQTASLPFGGSWSAVTDLSAIGSTNPSVAVDSNGNAVAAWVTGGATVFASTSSFGGAWTSPTPLSSPSGTIELDTGIADNGNATVVWVQNDGGNNQTHASTSVGGVWPPLNGVVLSVGVLSDTAVIGVSPSGYAVAAWIAFDGSNEIVQAATETAPNVWTAAQTISPAGMDVSPSDLDIAVNANGDAMVVWTLTGAVDMIQSSFLPFGSLVWSSPEDASPATENSDSPQVALDAAGNAIVAWMNENDDRIEASMHPRGGSWQAPPDTVSAGGVNFGPQTNMVLKVFGEYAVISWINSSTGFIQAVHTTLPLPPVPPTKPLPPSNFIGVVRENKFLNRTELVLKATWTASPSNNVVFYRIYKGGVVVDVVSASAPLLFKTEVHSRHSATKFEVAAVSSTGDESDHVPITIVR